MSAQVVGKAAGKAVGSAAKAASELAEGHVVKSGAKRDPELYVCSLFVALFTLLKEVPFCCILITNS
jgi:hypothetical protein